MAQIFVSYDAPNEARSAINQWFEDRKWAKKCGEYQLPESTWTKLASSQVDPIETRDTVVTALPEISHLLVTVVDDGCYATKPGPSVEG